MEEVLARTVASVEKMVDHQAQLAALVFSLHQEADQRAASDSPAAMADFSSQLDDLRAEIVKLKKVVKKAMKQS
jgi:hypothetical protein